MAFPLVSIVIVTWNGENLLRRFLPSVAGLTYPNYEVIIVDNASPDRSVEFIKKHYPGFKVIRCDKNLGTAQASNLGARDTSGEYIFWLSNDMALEPDILRYMVERAEADSKVGICTCKMRRITEDGGRLDIIDSIGGDIDMYGFPIARGINQEDRGQFDFATEVFFSFGGGLLIKKELFEKTGGFDQRLFTLGDDIDLCWRTRLLGYKVIVEPRALLYHRVSATLGSAFGRSQKRYWSERHTMRMLLKNYSAPRLFLVFPRYMTVLFMEIAFMFFTGRPQIGMSGIRAIWWNIRNLPDTLKKRRTIQHSRAVKDDAIVALMSGALQKFQIFKDYLRNYKNEDWRRYFEEVQEGP